MAVLAAVLSAFGQQILYHNWSAQTEFIISSKAFKQQCIAMSFNFMLNDELSLCR